MYLPAQKLFSVVPSRGGAQSRARPLTELACSFGQLLLAFPLIASNLIKLKKFCALSVGIYGSTRELSPRSPSLSWHKMILSMCLCACECVCVCVWLSQNSLAINFIRLLAFRRKIFYNYILFN